MLNVTHVRIFLLNLLSIRPKFLEDYTPNWITQVFVIRKSQRCIIIEGTYITEDLNDEEIIGNFYK